MWQKAFGVNGGYIIAGVLFVIGVLIAIYWNSIVQVAGERVRVFTDAAVDAVDSAHTDSVSTDSVSQVRHIAVNGEELSVEVAETKADRVLGLSHRQSLESGHGMLFIFPEAGRHGIWMKDMYLSLDILWLNEHGGVVHAEYAVTPETYPKIFYPPEPAWYVLEVPAGYASERGIALASTFLLH